MPSQLEKRKAKEKKTTDEPITANYTHKAFDVFFDETLKRYIKVTVEYDLVNGVGRVKSKDVVADSQPVAMLKMNHVFARKVFKLPEE